MLIFQFFKVVIYSFIQLIKGNTKGVTFKVNIVVVKYQATQYSGVGLAKLLFKNISLLIKVYKNGQFKIKVIIFITVLKFISIKLSQVSQLFTISLYLDRLRIYNLDKLQIYNLGRLWVYNLGNSKKVLACILIYRGITVHNLSYKGIAVRSLKIGYILASKVSSKAA